MNDADIAVPQETGTVTDHTLSRCREVHRPGLPDLLRFTEKAAAGSAGDAHALMTL